MVQYHSAYFRTEGWQALQTHLHACHKLAAQRIDGGAGGAAQ